MKIGKLKLYKPLAKQGNLLKASSLERSHRLFLKRGLGGLPPKSLVVKPSRMAERISKKQQLITLMSRTKKDLQSGTTQFSNSLASRLKTRICRERKQRREYLFRAGAGSVIRKKPQSENKWTSFSFVRC